MAERRGSDRYRDGNNDCRCCVDVSCFKRVRQGAVKGTAGCAGPLPRHQSRLRRMSWWRIRSCSQGLARGSHESGNGPCALDPNAKPCFITRPKNLTPDNATGTGRFTERQIFNALRFGLRPEETPDVEITSTTPGQGNFPLHPHYLAPPMPWMAWRHMPDADLWAIAAYLKNGLKPFSNKVADSEGPPDFWAGEMIPAKIGTYPAAAFPTANEVSK